MTGRRQATHPTPISRPRNCQRENLHDGNENRIGSIMAMMMMSQASDRDERQEEREERRQEFRLQLEMQRQQMQQQQNMMAVIMIGLMGRNGSVAVPNVSTTGQQRNEGDGEIEERNEE